MPKCPAECGSNECNYIPVCPRFTISREDELELHRQELAIDYAARVKFHFVIVVDKEGNDG